MPYKDEEVQREYQKLWMQRKRKGEETKTKTKLTDEERESRRKARIKAWNEKRKKRNKERLPLLKLKFGTSCYFCDSSEDKHRLAFHEKNGNEHPEIYDLSETKFNSLLEGDEFVRLCYGCHMHVHWCMDFLHMSWEEISSRAK